MAHTSPAHIAILFAENTRMIVSLKCAGDPSEFPVTSTRTP